MTKVHAGGKFDHDTYKVSAGLHGIGVTAVDALSEWIEVEVRREGQVWRQDFRQGVRRPGRSGHRRRPRRTGTKIRFLPDVSIFTKIDFDYDILEKRLRELAFLNKGIAIRLTDERGDEPKEQQFFSSAAAPEFVAYLNRAKTALHRRWSSRARTRSATVEVEVALQYNESIGEMRRLVLQQHPHRDGGTHLTGFRTALTRTLNQLRQGGRPARNKDLAILGEDFREGLTAIVSVRVPDPKFEGQTKTQAEQRRGRGDRRQRGQRPAGRLPGEQPRGRQEGDQEGDPGGRGPRGGPQGAKARPQPQGGPLRRRPARQAHGLHHPRPGRQRALPGRGRLGRRHRRRGARPVLPGHPAAPRQDPQRREAPGSTASWATRRSATSSRPSATASATRRTPPRGATARSS